MNFGHRLVKSYYAIVGIGSYCFTDMGIGQNHKAVKEIAMNRTGVRFILFHRSSGEYYATYLLNKRLTNGSIRKKRGFIFDEIGF